MALVAIVLASCGATSSGSGATSTAVAGSPTGSVASTAAASGPAESSSAASPAQSATPSADWQIDPALQAGDDELGVFTGRTSVKPGEPLPIHATSAAGGPATVSVFRLGSYGTAGGTRVAGPVDVSLPASTPATSDPTTRAVRTDWPVATTLQTSDWQPGFYFVHVESGGKKVNVPFVVRSPSVAGAVVFVAGDTTWQAYNTWGGRSLYTGPGGFADRSYAVSFDRPYSRDWQIWYDYDIPAVNVLEASGVKVAYTTVSAVGSGVSELTGAAGVMSNGHDEYWPLPYREQLAKARDAGANLAFLGANPGYWRVRLEDTAIGPDRLVVGYKSATLDPLQNDPQTTARYRDQPDPLPENTILGNYYDCFPSRGDMTIVQPDFFLFSGTQVTAGTNIPGLIGNESDRAYASSGTPRPIQIPAISHVTCKDSTTVSTMSYYSVASGAGVWSSGTMNWGRAMSGPNDQFGLTDVTTAFTRAVTGNLAKAMAAGPMGRTHPAQDDWATLASLGNVNHADADPEDVD